MTKVRVWLSHDGYRDPDDNLAQLVGAVKARDKAKKDADVSVAGLIFGDTTDGGQYHMVYPGRNTPSNMDGDPRFDNVAANKVAAGNYAFSWARSRLPTNSCARIRGTGAMPSGNSIRRARRRCCTTLRAVQPCATARRFANSSRKRSSAIR